MQPGIQLTPAAPHLQRRRRSAAVRLILSGSLVGVVFSGCSRAGDDGLPEAETGPAMTNNTYNAAYGYWHAPYHGWYPLPYNYYREGQGYYHGGEWTSAPFQSDITVSRAWTSFRSSGGGSTSHSSEGGHISRGGFGGHSAHVGG